MRMRRCRIIVALLALPALGACARQAPPAAVPGTPLGASGLDALAYGAPPASVSSTVRRGTHAMPMRSAPALDEGPYTLDAGDKLRIVVFGQDALSNSYAVDAGGRVALPLIGAVPARGLTTAQLSEAIAARLKQKFLRDPSVVVEVETYRPFFVLGEVAYPGQYPYVPNMTVESAVAIAGGFTPRAARDRVTVTRKANGSTARYSLPLQYPVRPGDTLTVSERWF
jgi:polysaccharide export outer membrane protein